MVKDNSERGNPLPPIHWLFFTTSKGSFINTIPNRVAHTTFVKPDVEHWLEREKEMFYLTTHSIHYIYGYMEGKKEMFYLTMHTTHFIYCYMGEREKCFI